MFPLNQIYKQMKTQWSAQLSTNKHTLSETHTPPKVCTIMAADRQSAIQHRGHFQTDKLQSYVVIYHKFGLTTHKATPDKDLLGVQAFLDFKRSQ